MAKKMIQQTIFSCDSAAEELKMYINRTTVLPAKCDSDIMFCLESYQRPIIDRSLVY